MLIRKNGKWIDDGKPSPYAKNAPKVIIAEGMSSAIELKKAVPSAEVLFHAGAHLIPMDKPKGKPGRPKKIQQDKPKAVLGRPRKYPKPELPKAMFNSNNKERLTSLQRDEIREAHRDEIRASMGLKPFNED